MANSVKSLFLFLRRSASATRGKALANGLNLGKTNLFRSNVWKSQGNLGLVGWVLAQKVLYHTNLMMLV